MTLPCSEFPHVTERLFDVLATDGTAGPVVRRLKFTDTLRRWRVIWPQLTKTEKDAVQTDYRAASGPAGTFSYTPADVGAPVTVRFRDPRLRVEMVTGGRWRASAIIEEVLLGTST